MGARPPFLSPAAFKRKSLAPSMSSRWLWFDPADNFEYTRCPKGLTFHRINPKADTYQDIDSVTGVPVAGGWGTWRRLG